MPASSKTIKISIIKSERGKLRRKNVL